MDALEARLQFIQVLKSLPKTLNLSKNITTTSTHGTPNTIKSVGNSSSSNSDNPQDPTVFYMKHYLQHYEDFQQCMLDTMSKMDPLDRLYILIYYSKIIHELYIHTIHVQNIEQATDTSIKSTVETVLYDHVILGLHTVCELACPKGDMKAFTNLPYCINFYDDLKFLFQNASHGTIDTELSLVQQHITELKQYREELFASFKQNGILTSEPFDNKNQTTKNNTNSSEVQVVLNRMEMDRDRHKKLKEQNWQINRTQNATTTNAISNEMLAPIEFEQLWNTTPAFDIRDGHFAKQIQTIANESYALE
ncbi:similar to Saccharomyces cerevisiae YML112W CTK3 Gamma subunit of C-terminal domain kinase I (CTDK-I) [Maudiozyma saulgeensis]|uniref:Similar to Saccharomyces cerevisiae YML112W CTK3 Gamma subunit of C-terminal domain kinase I (CTDK-I) n=1 Tax=Maudiozyma saulgeensis TaxID=1789683 RepID=A0A1X7R4I2_9SACH|nr:similar to Saccharomyces cerevisiae YML112W CTK3 Gamma subunit of C-terminal domain kinase I (CTDK-I) [Kazachstania saulgeensis]